MDYRASMLFLVMLLVAGIGPVHPAGDPCQSRPDPAVAAPADLLAQVPYGNGLLWRIEGHGIEPAYLFGTIHLEDPRVTELPPAVRDAFEGADSFITEVVMHPAARAAYAQGMRLPEGTSLQQYLTAPLFQRLVQITGEQYEVPAAVLDNLKPWAVFTLLSRPPPVTGRVLDELLDAEAVRLGKAVEGLETVEELVAVLDAIPLDDQIAILADTICNRSKLTGQLEDLTTLYLSQDLAGMLAVNAGPHQDEALFERFMERTLYQRNRRMARRIRDRLADGRVFIAVGALHLPGEKGILRILETRGYRISRVY
jgi:uncharacterized protein YbaP (TraB family)